MTTVLLAYPGCLLNEVWLAAEWLGEGGVVRVATPDGRDHLTGHGPRLVADAAIGDLDPAEIGCLLVPDGDPESVLWDPTVERVIAEAAREEAWIGAIGAGPALLGRAGLLVGRRFTHGYGPDELPLVGAMFAGGAFTGAPVEVDAHLVTAQAPHALRFAAELARRTGVLDAAEVDRRVAWRRG